MGAKPRDDLPLKVPVIAVRPVERARLRDEVDLQAPSAYLLTVVDQMMESTRTSLWLRPPRSGKANRIMRIEGGAVE